MAGYVASGFEPVREAFEANFALHGEAAAQCCVHVGSERVVDLWGGYADNALQVVFSATKGATAACANLLVQRGTLDLDAPVTRYWPEYGVNGKERTLVRWLLSHKAGVLAPAPGLTMDSLEDWDTIVESLAASTPLWEPGTAYGYHAYTFGWLVGEIVRRVDGRSLGRFFAEEIAGPAGADFWIGLPETEEHRVAPLVSDTPPVGPNAAQVDLSAHVGPYLLLALSLDGMLPDPRVAAQDRRFRRAEIGGAGGVASGRGLSCLYAFLLRELRTDTIADILRPETEGPDLVLSSPARPVSQRFGRGFSVPPAESSAAGVPVFGHDGAGGSCGFADPRHRVAFGYAMTAMKLGPTGEDPRVRSLVRALYGCLDGI